MTPPPAHTLMRLRPVSAVGATLAAALTAVLTVALLVALPATPSAHAATGTWVVSVGDSYISGEAGRWAGNTNDDSSMTDALGSTAYWDTPSGEAIERCHRSRSAEVFIGAGTSGVNLACSGARTGTFFDSDGNFKPGLDFYADSAGNRGQARMLQDFATTHQVRMVALSIGGNDFNFGSIVQSCVTDWLSSPSWWPNYCSDDSSVTSNFTSTNIAAVTARIASAIRNIRTALANDGYADSSYTIMVQTYPSPLPSASGFRYSETGFTRQYTGGCGFWNTDANWANATALPTINNTVRNAVAQTGLSNVRIMDVSAALTGRRLCENTVGLLEEEGLSSWQNAGAVNRTEWVEQIRTLSTVFGPYFVQESLHPNYWGQLALRNCLRQAWNGGLPRGGTCTIGGTGLNGAGEPVMTLH
ncbi:MAG TPA: hypothetical protein VIR27_13490 [Mycobacteriales bacterium]